MWETLEHSCSIEIPHRGAAHHVKSERAENAEIDGRIGLLHEAILLCARPDAVPQSERPYEALHEEFPGERQYDDVESDKGKIAGAFGIMDSCIRAIASVVRNKWVI